MLYRNLASLTSHSRGRRWRKRPRRLRTRAWGCSLAANWMSLRTALVELRFAGHPLLRCLLGATRRAFRIRCAGVPAASSESVPVDLHAKPERFVRCWWSLPPGRFWTTRRYSRRFIEVDGARWRSCSAAPSQSDARRFAVALTTVRAVRIRSRGGASGGLRRVDLRAEPSCGADVRGFGYDTWILAALRRGALDGVRHRQPGEATLRRSGAGRCWHVCHDRRDFVVEDIRVDTYGGGDSKGEGRRGDRGRPGLTDTLTCVRFSRRWRAERSTGGWASRTATQFVRDYNSRVGRARFDFDRRTSLASDFLVIPIEFPSSASPRQMRCFAGTSAAAMTMSIKIVVGPPPGGGIRGSWRASSSSGATVRDGARCTSRDLDSALVVEPEVPQLPYSRSAEFPGRVPCP
ncbi:hypothetical protein FB451DRAFT_132317 [Mycena latifolia]|nr:hypothetical protein FB451DRAFT_132317 [Mycena latifolia]